MSASSLPDFDHTLRLSQGSLDAPDLAECHGLLCGMVCRESSRTPRDFLDQLSAMELVVRPGQALNAALADAWRSTVEQLADEDMGFTLWLPDDEEPLEDRTVALAQWCSGFLAGLLVVPRFVLGELQHIADDSHPGRRNTIFSDRGGRRNIFPGSGFPQQGDP